MTTHKVRLGQRVLVSWLHDREGTVTQLEGDLARVELLSDAREEWVRVEHLGPVFHWGVRSTTRAIYGE
jgi:membrane protein required for beta-lactamase induction